jgi:hypothetical protein
MKNKNLTIVLIWLAVSLLALMLMNSCSSSYHFNKFVNKGGKIETKTDTIQVQKTIKLNGKDSIIFVEMPLKCPEVQIPPTRQEIRYKYKIKRDSIETVRYVTKWKTKEVIKVAKTENSDWWKFRVGLAIGFITSFLVRQVGIMIMKRL